MDIATIGALYRYNSWATARVLDAVSPLAEADFTRDLKNSFGSIRDTLTHVVWAEWIWLERWKGESPTTVFSPAEFATVDGLRERFNAVATERSLFLDELTPARLSQVVEYVNMKGQTWRYPLWQQLQHVVNHSTYHRGQVTTMLRQLGAEALAPEFLDYYDEGGL